MKFISKCTIVYSYGIIRRKDGAYKEAMLGHFICDEHKYAAHVGDRFVRLLDFRKYSQIVEDNIIIKSNVVEE